MPPDRGERKAVSGATMTLDLAAIFLNAPA
jgi:hypothetical protein